MPLLSARSYPQALNPNDAETGLQSVKMFAETPFAFLCPNTKRKGLGGMGGGKIEEALARQSNGRTNLQA